MYTSHDLSASIAVRALYELAARAEYLTELREEMQRLLGTDSTSATCITHDALGKAVRLDSFIREVISLKSSLTLQCVAIDATPLAGYTIPKGAHPDRKRLLI